MSNSKKPLKKNKKPQKTSNAEKNSINIDDIGNILHDELILKKRIIPAEKPMVRRTAKDFAEGAKPVEGWGSHRLVESKIRVIPEVKHMIKLLAGDGRGAETLWMRAAFRKAIREGLNVEEELSTEINTAEIPGLDES